MTWLLICDCSIMLVGTLRECLNCYKAFPNPMSMSLVKIAQEREIWKSDGKVCSKIKK